METILQIVVQSYGYNLWELIIAFIALGLCAWLAIWSSIKAFKRPPDDDEYLS